MHPCRTNLQSMSLWLESICQRWFGFLTLYKRLWIAYGTVDRINSLQCFPNSPSRDIYISRPQGSSYVSFSRVGSQSQNISDVRFELFLCNDSIRISNAIFYPSSIKCLRTHTQAISNGFPLHPCIAEYLNLFC